MLEVGVLLLGSSIGAGAGFAGGFYISRRLLWRHLKALQRRA